MTEAHNQSSNYRYLGEIPFRKDGEFQWRSSLAWLLTHLEDYRHINSIKVTEHNILSDERKWNWLHTPVYDYHTLSTKVPMPIDRAAN